VQRHPEPGSEFCGSGRLRKRTREAVKDKAAEGGCLDHGRGQRAEHDLIGDEITAALVGRDLAATPAPSVAFGPQQVACGDVPHPEPGCQPLALRAFARARGGRAAAASRDG